MKKPIWLASGLPMPWGLCSDGLDAALSQYFVLDDALPELKCGRQDWGLCGHRKGSVVRELRRSTEEEVFAAEMKRGGLA